jgi:hypothetical protein
LSGGAGRAAKAAAASLGLHHPQAQEGRMEGCGAPPAAPGVLVSTAGGRAQGGAETIGKGVELVGSLTRGGNVLAFKQPT